jgi:hypothetical protein
MTARNILLGFEGVLLLNTASTTPYATPTWDEIDTVKNMALKVTSQTADIGMRRGKGWGSQMNSIKDLPIEVEALYEKGNADLEQFFLAAITPRKFLDCVILDGPLITPAGGVASKGMRAHFNISDWELGQQLADGQMVKWTMAVGYFIAGEEPKAFTGTVAA